MPRAHVSSKKKKYWRNGCSEKVQFVTQAQAAPVVAKMCEKHGKEFHAYRCPHCHNFHVGSVRPTRMCDVSKTSELAAEKNSLDFS